MGAANMLSEESYASTAETLTRSRLCVIPIDQLKQAMEKNGALGLWISTMFGRALYASMIRISEGSCLTGRQRLEKFLLEMVDSMDVRDLEKPIKLPILLKQWELAQLLAVTPQHLCRLLTQMEKERLLVRENGWLILPKPKRLIRTGIHRAR